MVSILALFGVSLLTTLVVHAVIRFLWHRGPFQRLLSEPVTACQDLLDLERTLNQAYRDSRIPKALLASADLLTLLCVLEMVLAWVYLPAWYLVLGAIVLLPLLYTALFYYGIGFVGPWWGFPAAYVESLRESEEIHDWGGCRCRQCRAKRDSGHRWDSACRCEICGQSRHQWNGAGCARCGKGRDGDRPGRGASPPVVESRSS